MMESTLLKNLGDLLDRHGWPMVILLVLLLVLWRVAKWLAPWCEKIGTRHLLFMDTATENFPKQTQALEKIGDTGDKLVAATDKSNDILEAIAPKVNDLHEDMRSKQRGGG